MAVDSYYATVPITGRRFIRLYSLNISQLLSFFSRWCFWYRSCMYVRLWPILKFIGTIYSTVDCSHFSSWRIYISFPAQLSRSMIELLSKFLSNIFYHVILTSPTVLNRNLSPIVFLSAFASSILIEFAACRNLNSTSFLVTWNGTDLPCLEYHRNQSQKWRSIQRMNFVGCEKFVCLFEEIS